MYERDELREYIKNSELRIFNKKIKIRLSSELAKKYDKGIYTNYLIRLQKELEMLEKLQIKYPSNAKPFLYLYIVPDDNFIKLLQVPSTFSKGKKSGGKAVACYDLDGFNLAFGLSQNCLENKDINNKEIERIENEIHELSHIILGQFMAENQAISEGVAEALPLFGLDLEEEFLSHQEVLVSLDKDKIYSMKELIKKSRERTYGDDPILPGKSCSFRLSYLSSYLFVRGIMEIISEKYCLSKESSIQYFLEILKTCSIRCSNECLIYDIANALELPEEKLLMEKNMQEKAIHSILEKYSENSKKNIKGR